MTKDYDIGYCRPPQHTRFKKGQSGNPRGRRRRKFNFLDFLDSFLMQLAEPAIVTENGRRKKIAKGDLMVKQIVNKAAAGDLHALKQILQIWRQLGESSDCERLLPEVEEGASRSDELDPEFLKTLDAEELSRLYAEKLAEADQRAKKKK
jgi:hypothetical protein